MRLQRILGTFGLLVLSAGCAASHLQHTRQGIETFTAAVAEYRLTEAPDDAAIEAAVAKAFAEDGLRGLGVQRDGEGWSVEAENLPSASSHPFAGRETRPVARVEVLRTKVGLHIRGLRIQYDDQTRLKGLVSTTDVGRAEDPYLTTRIIEVLEPARGPQLWGLEPTGERRFLCAMGHLSPIPLTQGCLSD